MSGPVYTVEIRGGGCVHRLEIECDEGLTMPIRAVAARVAWFFSAMHRHADAAHITCSELLRGGEVPDA